MQGFNGPTNSAGLTADVGISTRLGTHEPGTTRNHLMQDILWIGAIIGLLAATLAYVRLLDKA